MALVARSDVSLGCATEAPDAAPSDVSLGCATEAPDAALSDASLGCATEAPDAALYDVSLEAAPDCAAPYPCECCSNTHGNESGFCDECSRRVGLPPGVAKRFALFRRRAQLLLITLTMSFFETDDQALLVVFCGSVALICVFYLVARVVARTIDWLELGDNAISAIEAGAFEFECLHRLDLDFNAIASLEQTFEFPGAECLIILDLNENSITTIDSGVFSNLNRLRWLDLGTNYISSLGVGAFDGLESLAVLFLYGNYLTRIEAETLENLTSLAVLDLWCNDVRSIDEGTFDGLDLTELNLERNQALSTLPHSLLDMTNLRAVYLYNTSICANDTPALDPAFDDLVERGVLSCEETDTGQEYYRQQYLASEFAREEYSYYYYE